jgi:flagellar biogenesis protein FliO
MDVLGGGAFISTLIALLATLALILGTALVLRKINPQFGAHFAPGNGNGRRLVKIESLPLTPQHTLHLVRVDGVEKTIVTGPQGAVVVEKDA